MQVHFRLKHKPFQFLCILTGKKYERKGNNDLGPRLWFKSGIVSYQCASWILFLNLSTPVCPCKRNTYFVAVRFKWDNLCKVPSKIYPCQISLRREQLSTFFLREGNLMFWVQEKRSWLRSYCLGRRCKSHPPPRKERDSQFDTSSVFLIVILPCPFLSLYLNT